MDNSTWDSVKNTLKVVAPGLATLFLGPAGGLVATGLSQLLLGKTNATPDEIEKSLFNLTSQDLLNLKKLEYDIKSKELDTHLEELRIYKGDMENAREREIVLATHGAPDLSINIIAYMMIGGLFATILVLIVMSIFHIDMDQQVEQLLSALIGSVTFATGLIVQYKFGSSKGSKEKDGILSYLVRNKT